MAEIKSALVESGMVENGLYLYWPDRGIDTPKIEVYDFGLNKVVNVVLKEDACHFLISPKGTVLRIEGCLESCCPNQYLRKRILDAMGLNESGLEIIRRFEKVTECLMIHGNMKYDGAYLARYEESFPYGATPLFESIRAFICYREGNIYVNLYAFRKYGWDEQKSFCCLKQGGTVEEESNTDIFPGLKTLSERICEILA